MTPLLVLGGSWQISWWSSSPSKGPSVSGDWVLSVIHMLWRTVVARMILQHRLGLNCICPTRKIKASKSLFKYSKTSFDHIPCFSVCLLMFPFGIRCHLIRMKKGSSLFSKDSKTCVSASLRSVESCGPYHPQVYPPVTPPTIVFSQSISFNDFVFSHIRYRSS